MRAAAANADPGCVRATLRACNGRWREPWDGQPASQAGWERGRRRGVASPRLPGSSLRPACLLRRTRPSSTPAPTAAQPWDELAVLPGFPMAARANPVTLMLNCGVSRAHAQRGRDVCAEWQQSPLAFRAPLPAADSRRACALQTTAALIISATLEPSLSSPRLARPTLSFPDNSDSPARDLKTASPALSLRPHFAVCQLLAVRAPSTATTAAVHRQRALVLSTRTAGLRPPASARVVTLAPPWSLFAE